MAPNERLSNVVGPALGFLSNSTLTRGKSSFTVKHHVVSSVYSDCRFFGGLTLLVQSIVFPKSFCPCGGLICFSRERNPLLGAWLVSVRFLTQLRVKDRDKEKPLLLAGESCRR